ncbi:hypothetical protein ACWD5B_07285 [Streptomyces tanashiensis]
MIHADLSDRQDGWREQLWTHQLTEGLGESRLCPACMADDVFS